MEQQTPAPLRADARRNREQIIEAARSLFVRIGPDVPMEEIARAAGVGIGTLYRRFPDRIELIKAVSLDNLTRLTELAARLDRGEPDPAAALTTLLHAARDLRLGIAMTTVSAPVFEAITKSSELAEHRDRFLAIVGRVLRRAQQSGSVRSDIGAGDLILALVSVSRLVPIVNDELGEMVFQRLFSLMTDGLRAVPGTPLPGRPIAYEDIEKLRHEGGLAGFGKPGPA